MCAQFLLKARRDDIQSMFGVELPDDWYFEHRILPYAKAPTIVQKSGIELVEEMVFSLIPPWSEKPKAMFSTHNCRIDTTKNIKGEEIYQTIYDSKLWKGPLEKRRCLIPISGFREPIYWGEHAGHWVEFIPKEGIIAAAGIYSEWTNKKTGEVIPSFSIVTHDPIKVVAKTGHSRSPVFLKPKAYSDWISEDKIEGPQAVEFLLDNRIEPKLEVVQAEAMAPSWKTRVKTKEAEFKEEMEFIKNRKKYIEA